VVIFVFAASPPDEYDQTFNLFQKQYERERSAVAAFIFP
jgi:hypothetical protein